MSARALSPATDLLALSSRVQVQPSVRPNTLGHQPLCVGQPLAEVIHVAVELPPLLYSTIEAPASGHRSGSFRYKTNHNKCAAKVKNKHSSSRKSLLIFDDYKYSSLFLKCVRVCNNLVRNISNESWPPVLQWMTH